jgi:hypothetical protein
MSRLITPRIVQGCYRSARYPGTARFAQHCAELSDAYRNAKPSSRREPIARLFAVVEERSRLFELRPHRHKLVTYLIDVGQRHPQWIREPESWFPENAAQPEPQLRALMKHLFARYRTPRWFEGALALKRGRPVRAPELDWFVHVGQGGSLRSAPGLDLPLTRRAAHEALQAPATMSPRQALLWGKLRAFGGSSELTRAVFNHCRFATVDDRMLKLCEKILRCPAFPVARVSQLLDQVSGRPSRIASQSALELLASVERQELQLALERAAKQYVYLSRPWAPLPLASSHREQLAEGVWRVRELLSAAELVEEGVRMRHCVATYVERCMRGEASIWSLELVRNPRETQRVTLRVCVAERTVVEAKRFANAPIDAAERRMIEEWAAVNQLRVGRLV